MSHKEIKTDKNWLSNLISNNFHRLEEILDDINNNEKIEKTVKSPPIFIAEVTNI
jgi:hypothetical protein